MLKIKFTIILLALVLSSYSQDTIKCVIQTDKGDIYIELYSDKAPLTVGNFMRYVDNKLYDESTFFRVCTPKNEADREVKIQVIQGGDMDEYKCFEAIEIESTKLTGIRHLDGAISMARSEPNSATSSFFICIGDQKELDFGGKRNPDGYGFAAFGRVYQGMDVVKDIQKGANQQQMLLQPVTIKTIKRIK